MLREDGFDYEGDSNGSKSKSCGSVLSEIKGLENVKQTRSYPRSSVLFAEGQTPGGVYVICEGKAKVSITSPQGRTLVIRVAQPGDVLGMNATLTGQPYMATVETFDRCRIDFISRADLLKLLEQDSKNYLRITESLSRQLSSLVDHTRLLFLSQTASEKVARLLLKWCDDYGKHTAQGIRIRSGLTHDEMAQMISTSRETVTRELSMLKRERILRADNGDLLVVNRPALMALVNR